MLRTLLPLALIATAGTAYAQTQSPTAPPATSGQTMTAPAPSTSTPSQTMPTPATPTQPMSTPGQITSTPGQAPSPGQAAPGSVDANGQPVIGRNDWVRQPGDRPGTGTQSTGKDANVAIAPPQARARAGVGQPGSDGTFRDEYGFRYDAQGNRIDARGRIMTPPMSRP